MINNSDLWSNLLIVDIYMTSGKLYKNYNTNNIKNPNKNLVNRCAILTKNFTSKGLHDIKDIKRIITAYRLYSNANNKKIFSKFLFDNLDVILKKYNQLQKYITNIEYNFFNDLEQYLKNENWDLNNPFNSYFYKSINNEEFNFIFYILLNYFICYTSEWDDVILEDLKDILLKGFILLNNFLDMDLVSYFESKSFIERINKMINEK